MSTVAEYEAWYETLPNVGPVSLSISAPQNTIRQAQALLADFPGGFQKAVRAAMTRTESKLRTNTDKHIRERYDISKSNIRSEENVKVRYTIGEGVQVNILFSGHRLPLIRFGGATQSYGVYKDRWTKVPIHGEERWVHPSLPARAHVLTSTAPYQFEDAFTQKMKSGHVGIFKNTGGMTDEKSEEISELMGPSVPQMLGHETVAEQITNDAYKDLDREIDDAVLRILSGWR